ncbi:restriction endonuclease subunit S [Actinomadura sp. DC4]|uniref:restriction endonuclease subunit S n=1 Tax=Actinomadura sp. DC4 TaxID=3055069 RepID=UPI0025B0B2AD|nr:restriction endonuclease subunit S [Actinomadura sp. DC4]MDN3351881.1 restriction endonuclease subunit S [Actinomadura sp. DC4]
MPELPSGWVRSSLAELTVIKAGSVPVGSNYGDIPVMGANGRIGSTSTSNFGPGYLVGRVGAAGAVNYSDEPCWASDNVLTVLPRESIVDINFLWHLLVYTDPRKLATRQAQPLLTQSAVASLKVVYPVSVAEQRRLAEILDTIDDQIGRSERVIAKLSLRQKGIQSYLLNQIQGSCRSLMDYLACGPRNGFSPKEVDEWTGLVAIGLGCLTESGFEPRQLKNVPSWSVSNRQAILEDGDLLISRANTRDLVGLAGCYREIGVPCIYPDLMMRLKPNAWCRADFLEITLQSSSVRRQIQAVAQGTSESMVKISASSVRLLKVAIPDLFEQDRIVRLVDHGNALIRSEKRQLEKLLLLRQGLMEDLLSGNVRLPD